MRKQEFDRNYREQVEKLESKHQLRIHHVKGTANVLKVELLNCKLQNSRLRLERDQREERKLASESRE